MICTVFDTFLEEKTIWIVYLSNGVTVYQDDGRPGVESNAWLRLKQHLKDNHLSIRRMFLRFRPHLVEIPPSADGYYFSKGFLGATGKCHDTYVCGPIYKGKDDIECVWFKIPEIEPVLKTTKLLSTSTKDFVILNE